MKTIAVIAFCAFLLNFHLNAQTIGSSFQSNINSASGSTALHFNSLTHSPLQLLKIKAHTVSIKATPGIYGINDLNVGELFASAKFIDNLYTGINLFGINNDKFSEFAGALNVLYSAEKFFVTTSVEYSQLSVVNYSEHNAVIFDIGGGVYISETLIFAFALKNLNGANYGDIDRNIYRAAFLGAAIKLNENLYCDIDTYIIANRNEGFSLTLKYVLYEFISVRTAFQSAPLAYELGIAIFPYQNIGINSSMYYHNYLGFIPAIGLSYGI